MGRYPAGCHHKLRMWARRYDPHKGKEGRRGRKTKIMGSRPALTSAMGRLVFFFLFGLQLTKKGDPVTGPFTDAGPQAIYARIKEFSNS